MFKLVRWCNLRAFTFYVQKFQPSGMGISTRLEKNDVKCSEQLENISENKVLQNTSSPRWIQESVSYFQTILVLLQLVSVKFLKFGCLIKVAPLDFVDSYLIISTQNPLKLSSVVVLGDTGLRFPFWSFLSLLNVFAIFSKKEKRECRPAGHVGKQGEDCSNRISM